MRDPLRTRSWMPGRLPAMLLALALAACGGGGDDAGGDEAAGADTAQAETQSVQVAAADSTCTPPPIPPQAVLTGKWQDLVNWINTNNVTFPTTPQNVAVDTVPLCPGCAAVGVRLQSTNSTYCITPQNVPQQRIAGMMVLLDTFPGKGGFGPIPAGDTIFMFSRGTPGASHNATLVYRNGTGTAQAPANSWKFYYCQDGHTNTAPAAQWRAETPAGAGGEKGKGKGRDDDGEGPGGTYGWMACANGCCQFYTPPPSEEETLGGPDAGGPPPAWCKTR